MKRTVGSSNPSQVTFQTKFEDHISLNPFIKFSLPGKYSRQIIPCGLVHPALKTGLKAMMWEWWSHGRSALGDIQRLSALASYTKKSMIQRNCHMESNESPLPRRQQVSLRLQTTSPGVLWKLCPSSPGGLAVPLLRLYPVPLISLWILDSKAPWADGTSVCFLVSFKNRIVVCFHLLGTGV